MRTASFLRNFRIDFAKHSKSGVAAPILTKLRLENSSNKKTPKQKLSKSRNRIGYAHPDKAPLRK
jgi:hypothetical protein